MKKLLILLLVLLSLSFVVAGYSNFDDLELDNNTGKLRWTNDPNTYIQRSAADTMLLVVGGTSVGTLTTSGMAVAGTLSSTGDPSWTSGVTVKPLLTISNTNADAASAELRLQKNSASPADNDDMGRITAYTDDTSGNAIEAINILLEVTDVTSENVDAVIDIDIATAGTQKEYLGIGGGAINLNEDSADIDVKWESDSTDSAFVLDAGAETMTLAVGMTGVMPTLDVNSFTLPAVPITIAGLVTFNRQVTINFNGSFYVVPLIAI